MAARPQHDQRLDVLTGMFAAAVLVTATGLAGDPGELSWASYPLAAVAGLAFTVRRRAPVATVVIAVAAVAAFLLVNGDGGPIFASVPVALACLGLARPAPRDWVPWALASVLVLSAASVIAVGLSLHELPVALLVLAAPRIAADRSRARILRENAQEEEAARRLVEERLRIAREVHDVVGHGLATIALRAGVADHVMTRDPREAQEALRAIRQISTEALEDLGALLGVLRAGGGDGAERAPVPDLEQVPRLVDGMRRAGMEVELEVDGDEDGVPEIVGAAAYRIVQEALTNVARHAGDGAGARVRLVRRRKRVDVDIVDDGRGAPADLPDGRGIAGMRERSAALGGSFEAGTRPEGGFRVAASLPSSG